jgi:hypothetical protein
MPVKKFSTMAVECGKNFCGNLFVKILYTTAVEKLWSFHTYPVEKK